MVSPLSTGALLRTHAAPCPSLTSPGSPPCPPRSVPIAPLEIDSVSGALHQPANLWTPLAAPSTCQSRTCPGSLLQKKKGIAEAQCAPACAILRSSLISTLAGHYAPKTIMNYLAGVRAWHTIHGLLCQPNKVETDALIKAAEALRPATSHQKATPALHLPVYHSPALPARPDAASPCLPVC